MATQRLPVPGADDDAWGTILNGFLRVLHAENGSIQQWKDDKDRPASPDEGETGINLQTGLFESYQEGQWVELTKGEDGCACPFLLVDSVFTDLPTVDFNQYSTVFARGYWSPDDWGGGLFVWKSSATDTPDGGRFFKSTLSSTGRWVRKFQDNVNVLHYGAVPDRTFSAGASGTPAYGGVYAVYGSPATGFTSKPASTKFANLTQAQNWYGANVVSALSDEIDYCAIQATMENNLEVFIPEGAYRCNQPLKMIRKRKLYGVGEQTIIYFDNCSAIVPRQTTAASPAYLNYVYQDNFYIGFLHLKGSYEGDGNGFDDGLSGINFPANPGGGYNQSAPSAYLCKIEHVTIEYFAGHGLKCLEEFNCAYDFISVHHCGGHGIFIQGGNTTSLRGCYPSNCGDGYASYRIIGGATLISCNGNDTANNYWGSFGGTVADNGYDSYPNVSLIGCNIEGAEKSIRLVSGGQITFENCYFQAKLASGEPYFIFDEGYMSSVVLINNRAYTISSVQPVAFIKCIGGTSGRYLFLGNKNYNASLQWMFKAMYVDALGNNIYGGSTTLEIPGVYAEQPTYAVYAATSKAFAAETMYLGQGNTTARMLSGTGSPQSVVSAPVGSIYLRQDGGTGTTFYVKESGTGNTGWVAK